MVILEMAALAIGVVVVLALIAPVLALAYKRYLEMLEKIEEERDNEK